LLLLVFERVYEVELVREQQRLGVV